jgi:hypothetical protein
LVLFTTLAPERRAGQRPHLTLGTRLLSYPSTCFRFAADRPCCTGRLAPPRRRPAY